MSASILLFIPLLSLLPFYSLARLSSSLGSCQGVGELLGVNARAVTSGGAGAVTWSGVPAAAAASLQIRPPGTLSRTAVASQPVVRGPLVVHEVRKIGDRCFRGYLRLEM